VEEIEPPRAHLKVCRTVVQMVGISERIPDEVAVPGSANDLPVPQPDRLLEQLATDLAMPHQNASIKDAGEVLV
jgi:hypothetical protein